MLKGKEFAHMFVITNVDEEKWTETHDRRTRLECKMFYIRWNWNTIAHTKYSGSLDLSISHKYAHMYSWQCGFFNWNVWESTSWQKGGKVVAASVSEQVCTIPGVEFPYNKIQFLLLPPNENPNEILVWHENLVRVLVRGWGVLKYFRRERMRSSHQGRC